MPCFDRADELLFEEWLPHPLLLGTQVRFKRERNKEVWTTETVKGAQQTFEHRNELLLLQVSSVVIRHASHDHAFVQLKCVIIWLFGRLYCFVMLYEK